MNNWLHEGYQITGGPMESHRLLFSSNNVRPGDLRYCKDNLNWYSVERTVTSFFFERISPDNLWLAGGSLHGVKLSLSARRVRRN